MQVVVVVVCLFFLCETIGSGGGLEGGGVACITCANMCLFVQIKMKNGQREAEGCEGARLSLAIHCALCPPPPPV